VVVGWLRGARGHLPNISLERTGLSVRIAGVVEPAVEIPSGVGEPEPPHRSVRSR